MADGNFFHEEGDFTVEYGSGRSVYEDLPDLGVEEDGEYDRILQVLIISFLGMGLMVGLLILFFIFDFFREPKRQEDPSPKETKEQEFDFSVWDDDGVYWEPGDPPEMDLFTTDEDEPCNYVPLQDTAMMENNNMTKQTADTAAQQKTMEVTQGSQKNHSAQSGKVGKGKVPKEAAKMSGENNTVNTQGSPRSSGPSVKNGKAKAPKIEEQKKSSDDIILNTQGSPRGSSGTGVKDGKAKAPKIKEQKKLSDDIILNTQGSPRGSSGTGVKDGKAKAPKKEEQKKSRDDAILNTQGSPQIYSAPIKNGKAKVAEEAAKKSGENDKLKTQGSPRNLSEASAEDVKASASNEKAKKKSNENNTQEGTA